MWVWGRAWPPLWRLSLRPPKLQSWLGAAPGASSCASSALAPALTLALALARFWRLGALRARLGSWGASLGVANCGFRMVLQHFAASMAEGPCEFCGAPFRVWSSSFSGFRVMPTNAVPAGGSRMLATRSHSLTGCFCGCRPTSIPAICGWVGSQPSAP